MNWNNYFQKTKNKQPSPLLIQALKELPESSLSNTSPATLDFGSGAGRDTRYLVSRGFRVTALDPAPAAPHYIQDLINSGQADFLSSISNIPSTQSFALINASYSLPFAGSKDFPQTWQSLISHLTPHGIITGQLFGVEDSWNEPDTKLSFFTAEQVNQLFRSFKVIHLEEQIQPGHTAAGIPKTWHIFHFIIQKSKS